MAETMTTAASENAISTQVAALAEKFNYLDRLRASGATNMFAASPFLARRFGLSEKTASAVLVQWMGTYDDDTSTASRARAAIAKATASRTEDHQRTAQRE